MTTFVLWSLAVIGGITVILISVAVLAFAVGWCADRQMEAERERQLAIKGRLVCNLYWLKEWPILADVAVWANEDSRMTIWEFREQLRKKYPLPANRAVEAGEIEMPKGPPPGLVSGSGVACGDHEAQVPHSWLTPAERAWLENKITSLREERAQIMNRRWVVQCGCYDDATAILDAIRRVHPPLVIQWTDDDGNVDHVEQMQPLPAIRGAGGEVADE